MACDSPFFIRTQQNYLKAWYYFMTAANQPYRFFVSPAPNLVSELAMDRQKVEHWVDGPVKCTPEVFHLAGSFIFSRDRIDERQYNQNSFLVPFMCSQEGSLETVVVGGIPQFLHLECLAHRLSLSDLRQAFDDSLVTRRGHLEGDSEYDFELKHHSLFLPNKIGYTNEVIKQTLLSAKKALVVVDKNHLDFLAEDWQNNVEVEEQTGKTRVQDLSRFYRSSNMTVTDLAEHVEKLVLLDYLYDSPITHYFVKFKRFPFRLEGSAAAAMLKDPETLMVVWYYFRDKQQAKVRQVQRASTSGQQQAVEEALKI